MVIDLDKIKINNSLLFRFKQLNDKYLLTNEIGEAAFLSNKDFKALIENRLNNKSRAYQKLYNSDFILSSSDRSKLVERYRMRNSFLWQGPTLHIIIVTLRCNHKCIYCQAGARSLDERDYDMDISTAKKVVDIIFESPSKYLTLEFQGGEPLINWRCIEYIVNYVKKKNAIYKKNIRLSLVSNFTLLSTKKLDFLIRNKVHLCTSLDGPEFIHNRYRKYLSGNSYKITIQWLKKIRNIYKKKHILSLGPNALTTITNYSLKYPRQIIDEYIRLHLGSIHLRPVTPIGISKNTWQQIRCSSEDFLDFYRRAFEYIIELNLKGIFFYEAMAKFLLTKILACREPNYLDLRSPCGAVIGQLAYNFDGNVYTCDEGRMLAQMGDNSFYLGNVYKNSLRDFIRSPVAGAMCTASCLDNLPRCTQCVYKPYCGVCPIYNYLQEGNIFRNSSERCKIYSGILDIIFEKLQDQRIKKEVFQKWLEN